MIWNTKIPYNLDHLFQFSITFNNSFLPFQFPYPSIFATCYPFPEIITSFPFPPNRANSLFYPSVRSSSPTYFTSTFISNSADGLVYPSTLSGEVLCDTLRLVWCVYVNCHNFWTNYLITLKFELDMYFMVPNNSTKFEIRSQVISGNHWGQTEGWTDIYTSNQTKGIT
jgi:hypothetical protein